MLRVEALLCSSLVLLLACGGRTGTPATGASEPEAKSVPRCGMLLSSPAFNDDRPIPVQYTGDGGNLSPELNWTDVPESTKSFALICSDPDAPSGTFIHWIIFNIPAYAKGLAKGIPAGASSLPNGTGQGQNSAGRIGYTGPKPPPGKPHRYFFRLYALDTILDLQEPNTSGLEAAMQDHTLGFAEMMGTYQR